MSKHIACSMIVLVSFCLAGTAMAGVCESYVDKRSPEIENCGSNKVCLRGVFNHALDTRNYGSKFVGCMERFKEEVAARGAVSGEPEVSGNSSPEGVAAQPAQPESVSNQVSASDCSKSSEFLKVATQACKTPECINQQMMNTLNIPIYKECKAVLQSWVSQNPVNIAGISVEQGAGVPLEGAGVPLEQGAGVPPVVPVGGIGGGGQEGAELATDSQGLDAEANNNNSSNPTQYYLLGK